MQKFEFTVVFEQDQDVEEKDNDLARFYALLEDLQKQGILQDYNCSAMG